MKRTRRLLSAAALAAGVVWVAVGCANRLADPDEIVTRATPSSCPGFVLHETMIDVDQNGGSFTIAPDHVLEFDPGAVPGPSRYTVRKGDHTTPPRNWAEVWIVPENGAPSTFAADVMLELSYAACADLGNAQAPLLLMKTTPPRKVIGGRDDKGRDVVRALLPHLSMFAIAQ